jgi:hypothetical protein
MSHVLTKSRMLSFRQCPKRLYLEVNQPELAQSDDAAEALMEQGTRVGEVARQVYGPGTLIGFTNGVAGAVAGTRRALAAQGTGAIFEGTFVHEGVAVRADILRPCKRGMRLTEVKSSTGLKDPHIEDCAIQARVIAGAGVAIEAVHLAFIDRDFVYRGDGDYRRLFAEVSLSEQVEGLRTEAGRWVRAAKKVLDGKVPDVAPGPQCTSPYECPFQHHCSPAIAEYPINILPWIRRPQIDRLASAGYRDVRDIPAGALKSGLHERVRQVSLSGRPYRSTQAAKALAALGYPRFFLDFETIQMAVPIWRGATPYQQHIFQWSCHIERRDGSLRHEHFLDLSGQDPVRAGLEHLLDVLGSRGPILVYSNFEQLRLKEAAKRFPSLGGQIDAVIARLFDLLPFVREHYYHPAMKGSFSIKAVLPTLAPELDYGDLSIQHGQQAMQAYLEAIRPNTEPKRRQQLRDALQAYCGRDTEAMRRIASALARSRRRSRARTIPSDAGPISL